MTRPSGFDRIPTNIYAETDPTVVRGDAPPDQEGRSALWSNVAEPPSFGAVTIECPRCKQTSVVGVRAALVAALPSLHLPLLRRPYASWMRCPACRRRTWVRLGIRL